MSHKVIIQTADVIYEGETFDNVENKMSIWNYHPVIGNTGGDRRYVLQLDDIKRIYMFDISSVKMPTYDSPRPDQVQYSIVLTGPQVNQRIRMITLSLDEYEAIEAKLANQTLNHPINLQGITHIAITYELADKQIIKINFDTGREIVAFSGPSVDMALIRRIFEDPAIIKIMCNGKMFKSSLMEKIKFVNVFDVMMGHISLNTTRYGELPESINPIEKLCKEYLGLPLAFFGKARVVAYLLPVYFRQESVLRQPFNHYLDSFQPQARSEMSRQYSTTPWNVSDQVTRYY